MIEYVERLVELVMDLNIRDLRSLHITYLLTFLRTKLAGFYLNEIAENFLPYKVRLRVTDPFFDGVKLASKIVSELKPNVNLSDIKNIVDLLRKNLKNVGAVFVIDCFSLIEFITYLTKLRLDGFESKLLDVYFTNIGEVTRYLTSQAGESIRGFSEYLANLLNAKHYDKYSYFDKLVHKSILLNDFLLSIPHQSIYSRILKTIQTYDSILITSDHGYDIVDSNGFIYVTHPSPSKGSILKFSNIAMYLVSWR